MWFWTEGWCLRCNLDGGSPSGLLQDRTSSDDPAALSEESEETTSCFLQFLTWQQLFHEFKVFFFKRNEKLIHIRHQVFNILKNIAQIGLPFALRVIWWYDCLNVC